MMAIDDEKLEDVKKEFQIDPDILRATAGAMRYDMRLGLEGDTGSTLKMLKSYTHLPSGDETGEFVAVDFGATDVRAMLIHLLGHGQYEVVRKVSEPLAKPGEYDYTDEASSAEDMFDFVAGLVDKAIDGDHETEYKLGHTFSFPSDQADINDARLIAWTKEFKTKGVEGQNVNELLADELKRAGAANVKPCAVINDTVAALLAAAYLHENTYIGSIYATGFNDCYLEPYAGKAEQPMVINMEAGGFYKVIPNKYDIMLDETSEAPGEQRLEKMVSGRYMGWLYGLAISDIIGKKGNFGFTSIDISDIVSDESDDRHEAVRILSEHTGMSFSAADADKLQDFGLVVIQRSAKLAAMSWTGIIWHLEGEKGEIRHQHIAVDGSVYRHMPRVKEEAAQALYELLGDDADKVDIIPADGGSCLGAALAAAMI